MMMSEINTPYVPVDVDFVLKDNAGAITIDENYAAQNFWKDVLIRYFRKVSAVIGLVLIILITLFAAIGPGMNEYTYSGQELSQKNFAPRVKALEKFGIFNGDESMRTTTGSKTINYYVEKGLDDVEYWFGSDNFGRDIWTRVWIGTRVSLYIAALAVLIDMVFGMTYGMISGYVGGRTDIYMQRFIEILSGIPNLVIVTLLVIIMKPGIMSITIALLITGWIGMSRVVRSQVLRLKELDYILASRTLGVKTFGIIRQDILPNIFGQVIIMSMFSIPNAIFYESFLAFIGLGLQPPMASLGVLISDGFKSLLAYPHMLMFPVVVLAILMLSFNMLADGLRDAFDPKMKDM